MDCQRSSTESSLEVFVVLVLFFFFASSSKCWASQLVQLVKSLPASAGDAGSVPGLGRFPREESGNPLQYSYLGSPMDRGACQATVHGVSKESDTTEWGLIMFLKKEISSGPWSDSGPVASWHVWWYSCPNPLAWADPGDKPRVEVTVNQWAQDPF